MTTTLYASTYLNPIWKGPKRYFAIVIYDSLDLFRQTCKEIERRHGDVDDEWERALGAFYPASVFDGKGWVIPENKHFGGTFRLAKGYITDEIVIHESVHAAAHIYRLDVEGFIRLGTSCDDREENLAYMIGDIGSEVAGTLAKARMFNET